MPEKHVREDIMAMPLVGIEAIGKGDFVKDGLHGYLEVLSTRTVTIEEGGTVTQWWVSTVLGDISAFNIVECRKNPAGRA